MNEIIVNDYPKSLIAESIKTVKTNLRFSSVNKKIKTILITSSMSGEGKSFVSANLAASYANYGDKVLIIDCDLRKGRQYNIFEPKYKAGLSNLLIDEDWNKNLDKYLQATEIENLDILTTGELPPDPTVLLESTKIEQVLEELKLKYDVIILDTPPVIGITDTLIISKLADVVLIVARARKTTLEILENTKKSLEKVQANIVGVILNRVELKNIKYYNGYY